MFVNEIQLKIEWGLRKIKKKSKWKSSQKFKSYRNKYCFLIKASEVWLGVSKI